MPLSVTNYDTKYQTVEWTLLSETNLTGDAANVSKFSDKTVQIIGDLDGATFALEGSMDNDTWVTLTYNGTDPITAVGMFWVWENPMYIRPALTVPGAETPALTVILGMSSLT